MADHVPRQGGGFLKGFLMGSLVSVLGAAVALLALPAPQSLLTAEQSEPAVTSDTGATMAFDGSNAGEEAGSVSVQSEPRLSNTFAPVPDLNPLAGDEPETPLGREQVSAPVPVLLEQAEQPETVELQPSINEIAEDAEIPVAPGTRTRRFPSEVADPLLPLADEPVVAPLVPRQTDGGVEVITYEPVPADVSSEALDASLPEADEGVGDTQMAAKPQSAPAGGDDTTSFDTASARVGRLSDAPEQQLPAAEASALGTVTQLAAPSPPRVPRATLAAPQSAFSDPVPLTLPHGSDTAVSGQEPETDVRDLPAVFAARSDRKQPEPAPQTPQRIAIAEGTGGAFERYAVAFDPPGDGPFVAVVLQDVGNEGISREELTRFGSQVTFAIDPNADDATAAQAQFRDAGFEVVALIPARGDRHIGQGTSPGRVASIADGIFADVPGAVALMDAPNGDLFRNNRVVLSLASHLRDTGHGFLIHERFGVNRAIGSLRQVDIPSAPVLRIIDNQRDQEAIRRNLDRAAIDAGKSGSVVVFGRTYPETISALGIWSLSRSGRGVVFAPLTATLNEIR